jgi:hypothetical protein
MNKQCGHDQTNAMTTDSAKLVLCVVQPDPFDVWYTVLKNTYNQYMKAQWDELSKLDDWWTVSSGKTTAYATIDGARCVSNLAEAKAATKTELKAKVPLVEGGGPILLNFRFYQLIAQWLGKDFLGVYSLDVTNDGNSVGRNNVVVERTFPNAEKLRKIFNNNFKAMLAGFYAYSKTARLYVTDVNVLKEVVPFLRTCREGESLAWFNVIVEEIWHANINAPSRIQMLSSDPSLVDTALDTFLYRSFYCFESYADKFDTKKPVPDCKLADSVTLPAVTVGGDVATTPQLRLCFKRLEYYPVYAEFAGNETETLIVGAGPTGLYTAYLMACFKIPFTLIESRQRWQSKQGREGWTFLSRTQRIYLNTRWWEYAGKDTGIFSNGYRFIKDLHADVRTAKEAFMQELEKYALNMTDTPFAHRSHKPDTKSSYGHRCVQIWEAQEILLRLLMDKLKDFKDGRVWFNAKLVGSVPGSAKIARSGVVLDFKCKRIVSCIGARADDKAVGFLDKDKEKTKLTPVTIQYTDKGGRLQTTKTTDVEVAAFVFQPHFAEKTDWTKVVKDSAENALPGDNLSNIRFFPGHNGGIDYVAFICQREELANALTGDLPKKVRQNKVVKLNGHDSLEESETNEIAAFFYKRYVDTLGNAALKENIKKCKIVTWAPDLKLMRRSASAFGSKNEVVFLGDACAQPNFFTGTGFASGWSMAESFVMAEIEERGEATPGTSFNNHNERVTGFVGKPEAEHQSELYMPSNALFEHWINEDYPVKK